KKFGGNMNIDLIAIGGSAGSLQVVLDILPQLRPDLSAAIVIILHRKATPNPEILIDLLNTKSSLLVKEAEDKEKIIPGIVYVAPADYHLFLESDHSFSLDISEKVNFSRPSIDLTFSTGSDAYKERTIGILLSGANSDGVRGLETIKKGGGYCIVQDPATAQVAYMPAQAIVKNVVDLIASPLEIAHTINTYGSPFV